MIGFLLFVILTFFLMIKLNEILGLRTGFYIKKENQCDFSSKSEVKETAVSEVDKKILRIKKIYSNFDSADFLKKAEKAFEIIFEAYSKGDVKTLKGLLSPRIFNAFSMAIEDRKKRGETLEGISARFINSEIVGADSADDDAFITVKFETEQSNVLKSKDGTILEGNVDFVENRVEVWTFSRKKSSTDSRWYLCEIKS